MPLGTSKKHDLGPFGGLWGSQKVAKNSTNNEYEKKRPFIRNKFSAVEEIRLPKGRHHLVNEAQDLQATVFKESQGERGYLAGRGHCLSALGRRPCSGNFCGAAGEVCGRR